jgi:superfamily II DNA or RNA helicase/predicted O-methyltransferase YrrM
MASLADCLEQLGKREPRGREFERLCQWYLENDPCYAGLLTNVWLWDEWPGREGARNGIDLVADTSEGELWAIRAKADDEGDPIKKAEIDAFLAAAPVGRFAFRLLIGETDRLAGNARRSIEKHGLTAGYRLRPELEQSPIDWEAWLDHRRNPQPEPAKPRPHQRRAIRDVVRGFEKSDRGQLVMASGTGKPLVALWLRETLEARRTLYLAPSLSVLSQTMREWSANASEDYRSMVVCADQTASTEDHLVSHTADLGVPVTVDPEEIAKFLRRQDPSVVFSTFQSLPRIAEAFECGAYSFDLAMVDDAHRLAAHLLLSSDFASILADDSIRARRRLFMTATPAFFTSRRPTPEADYPLISMDEAEYGPVFHELTLSDAIGQKLVSDYQVVVTGITSESADARALASGIGLAKAMQQFDLRTVISFHDQVERAREFSLSLDPIVESMPSRQRPSGPLRAQFVSGQMPARKRAIRLSRLKEIRADERSVLANAGALAEGTDVPAVDGIAFISPKRSALDLIQAVARAVRMPRGKKVGTIVVPVPISNGASESDFDSPDFGHLWDVLKALRAHDDALAEELDELAREMGRERQPYRPQNIVLELPGRIGRRFEDAFNARLLQETTFAWDFWYGLLERYVDRDGSAAVPHGYVVDGFRLGQWVNVQRIAYREDLLSDERIAMLEELPEWQWEPVEGEAQDVPTDQPIEVPWPLGHYYSPMPDVRKLAVEPARSHVWPASPHPTPGIDWREKAQLGLCRKFARQTALEFAREPTGDPTEYDELNSMYHPLDALVLQALLRNLKPTRMIEIGSGYSSLVSARVNREFLRGKMRFTCIEPNPRDFLVAGVPGISDLHVQEVQDVPLELYGELEDGDVLFIDTSHTVKTGGDVSWIYNQILPRLNPGVVVHLHDIFMPGDYPEQWVVEGWGWNETYLVQSFLAFNSAFEILFGVRWMIQNHWDALVKAFPGLTEARAEWTSALWIRRTGTRRR